MTDHFIFEIAVESTGAGLAAARGGADRIELCADLRSRGVTPSRKLMVEARTAIHLPIHVMIRPRAGDFVYTGEEFAEMQRSIVLAHELKMDGVVLGILRTDGTVDVQCTRELVGMCGSMQVTFHRAFDECGDLFNALEDVIATGASRILTSGGAKSAVEGIDTLRGLIQRAGDRIVILPGGGIQPANFAQIRSALVATEYHSGLGSVLEYGSSDFSAFELAVRSMKDIR
jgi:copper homeostasis protein